MAITVYLGNQQGPAGPTGPQGPPGTGGGSGTVTAVSVVAANGFGGSVATGTTTPAITLTTGVTGLLKGNGTAVSAAVAGTDYLAPAGNGSQLTGLTVSQVSGAAPLASPAFTTPNLGTPSAGTLTNCTGLPVSTGVSGLATGVAAFLAAPSSANLAAAVTDETGAGALVFATSPTLVTPALGTPTALTLTNATGLPVGGIVATGTPSSATFLRGDGTWGTPTAVTRLAPTQVSSATLQFWGDTSKLGVPDGSPVPTLYDYSGLGHHFAALGTAGRATYLATGMGGQPCLSFDGVANEYTLDSLAGTFGGSGQSWSFWCVLQLNDVGPNPYYPITIADPTGNLPTNDAYYRAASRNWWSDRRRDDGTELSIGGGRPTTGALVFGYEYNGSTGVGTLYINNVIVGSGSQGTGTLTPTQLTLFAHRRGGTNDGQVKGLAAHPCLFTGVLSAGDRAALVLDLATRQGVVPTDPADSEAQIAGFVTGYRAVSLDPFNTVGENTTPANWYAIRNTGLDMTAVGAAAMRAGYHNRMPAVRLGGNRYTMPAALPAALSGTAQPSAVYCSARWFDPTAVHTLWSFSDGTATGSYYTLYVDATGVLKLERRTDAGVTTTLAAGATMTDSLFHNYVAVYTGSTAVVYRDGAAVISGSLGGGACTLSVGAVGALLRNVASVAWYDEVTAFGVYSAALSTTDAARLTAILAADCPVPVATVLVAKFRAGNVYSDLRASAPSTADGADVYQWVSSVNGFSFKTVNGGTSKGVLKLAQVNGKPAVRQSSTALIAAALSSYLRAAQPFTLTITAKYAVADTGIPFSWESSLDSSTGKYAYYRLRDSSGSNGQLVHLSSAAANITTTTDPGAGYVTYALRFDGTTLRLHLNGGTAVSATPAGSPNAQCDWFCVGGVVRVDAPNGTSFGTADVAALDLRDYDDAALTDSAAQAAEFLTY